MKYDSHSHIASVDDAKQYDRLMNEAFEACNKASEDLILLAA